MEIQASFAAGGYARARSATQPEAEAGPGLLRGALQDFTAVMERGEAAALASMSGGGDTHSLVQALSATELAVETAVVIRDRVVEAYQELMRMPV